jgi:hypothetical protein
VQTLIRRGVFPCRRADVDYFFQGNAADFALDPLEMQASGTYLDFPAAWERFVTEIPPEDQGDVSQSADYLYTYYLSHSLRGKRPDNYRNHFAVSLINRILRQSIDLM